MAKLELDGLEGLISDFSKITELPLHIQSDMLMAQADIVIAAQKKEIDILGLKKTGQLKESITKTAKTKTDGLNHYVDVYPQGIRKNGMRNEEVGFILEFGAPSRNIKASKWMESANEKSADATAQAAENIYDNFLKENNL